MNAKQFLGLLEEKNNLSCIYKLTSATIALYVASVTFDVMAKSLKGV